MPQGGTLRSGVGSVQPRRPHPVSQSLLRSDCSPTLPSRDLEGEGYPCEGVNLATSVWLSAA